MGPGDLFVLPANGSVERHTHGVDVAQYGNYQGSPYYVMDYYGNNLGAVIGETYRTEAPSRPLRIEKVVHYTRQMLAGLHRLHAAGIVHRDMKPENMFSTVNRLGTTARVIFMRRFLPGFRITAQESSASTVSPATVTSPSRTSTRGEESAGRFF